ncbi:hypothetical protein [Streptomyces aureoversilis]|uniref:Uncharacterized protein n=1 Tax=Streptomyces aureoversilis TaxID=67277 RepID=A0ABW0A815_9ACTN
MSQATISRRWRRLLPVVGKNLAGHVPDLAEVSVGCAVLVERTLMTTGDWANEGTALFSGEHRDTGFSLQIAATLGGGLLTVPAPVPSSRHDARAWRISAFPELFATRDTGCPYGFGQAGMAGRGS